MLLKYCITFAVLAATVSASWIPKENKCLNRNTCPTFTLRCPDCPSGTKCVYPDSGGCLNAGIPTCQSIECPNTLCLVKRIPCPKECPYSCKYNGPPCCPFLGEPECVPQCQTFVPCKVTPCPASCPGNCHYPDADFCCPKSGKAVCNLVRRQLIETDPLEGAQPDAAIDGLLGGHRPTSKTSVLIPSLTLPTVKPTIPFPTTKTSTPISTIKSLPSSSTIGTHTPPTTIKTSTPLTTIRSLNSSTIQTHTPPTTIITPTPYTSIRTSTPITSIKTSTPITTIRTSTPISTRGGGSSHHSSHTTTTTTIKPTHTHGWGYDHKGVYHKCHPNDKACLYGSHKKDGFYHDGEWYYYNNGNQHHGAGNYHHGGKDHYYGNKKHHHYDNDYYEGLFIGGLKHHHKCSTCTKTVTDVDIELTFVTTTASSDDVICPQYIISCPKECPYDCLYPMDQPCPFTHKPWCPSVFDHNHHKKMYTTLSITQGYSFPHFPTDDPFHSIFTSMWNHSGVTATTTFVPEVPTTIPTTGCPLIYRYCPVECPHSCLRPDVPCPFAAEGYCPGNSPTTTVPESALITPTVETVIGGELVCPLYMLACPMCPQGYTCKRDLTGRCPNTNIPYCVSKIKMTATHTSPIDHYDEPPRPTHLADSENEIYAQNVPDVCKKAGLIKVDSEEVFNQLQEKRANCKNCPVLEWDEYCPNTCVFGTEDNCCIQSICLPH